MSKKRATKKGVKPNTIIPNLTLYAAVLGFRPVFGNDTDLRISKKMAEYNALLPTVDNEIMRGLKVQGQHVIAPNAKMRSILKLEKELIDAITKRNYDF